MRLGNTKAGHRCGGTEPLMKKTQEFTICGKIMKAYKECGFNNALEFIKFMNARYGPISSVKIGECTDRDYKTYDGLTFYYDELLNRYEEIVKNGEDVSFHFEININSVPVMLCAFSDGDITISSDSGIELEEIIGSKKDEVICSCGAVNSVNSKFCSECGELLKKPGNVVQNPGAMSQNPGLMPQNPGIMSQNPGLMMQNPGIMALNPGIMAQNPGIFAQNPIQCGGLSPVMPEKPKSLEAAPPDKHLKMLANTYKAVCGLPTGRGRYSEIVLYKDEAKGTYELHTYSGDGTGSEHHCGYKVEEAFAEKILKTIKKNKFHKLNEAKEAPLCGGMMVLKFVDGDGKYYRLNGGEGPIRKAFEMLNDMLYEGVCPERRIIP